MSDNRRSRNLARIDPLGWIPRLISVWLACVLIGSVLPGPTKARLGTTTTNALEHQLASPPRRHRLAHFSIFGGSALLLMLIVDTRREMIVAASSAFFMGVLIECVQPIVFATVFEWWDVRDDAIAVEVVLGVTLGMRRSSPSILKSLRGENAVRSIEP